jgi:hypothetical protein
MTFNWIGIFSHPCGLQISVCVSCRFQRRFIHSYADLVIFLFSTWYTTLYMVVKKHGVKNGLYRGLTVNYIKVTPMVAVSFTVYELMKQLFGLDTHVER